HFTSTDAAATLPANSALTNGAGTFTATLNTIGNQTITATDTVDSSITGTSIAIGVASTTTNNTDFVKQVYVDLLHRAAELQGYTYWTDLLNRGVLTRLQFVQFVQRSTEYRSDV